MRKRKTWYPPAKTATRRTPPGSEISPERPNLANINLAAGVGQAGFAVGDRVRIEAGGTHSGEYGVIERLSGGVIPSALVRADGGGCRQVRTIDLAAVKPEPPSRD